MRIYYELLLTVRKWMFNAFLEDIQPVYLFY